MVIRCEESQTTLRRNVWRKREHPLRRAAVPCAACTYPGPAGLKRLWTTRHDLRSGLRRCFVYQRTLTLARARATGPRVPTAWYIIMTCTRAAPSHEGRVCRRPVYNSRGWVRGGRGEGARHRVKRYHSLADRVKRIKPETFILSYSCAHEMCCTHLHGSGSVLSFLHAFSSWEPPDGRPAARGPDNNINGVFLIKTNIPVESSSSSWRR